MRLEWSIFAIEDRNAIFDYIDADSPQAAVNIDDRIEEQVERLLQFPQLGRAGGLKAHASWLSSTHPML